MRNKSKAIRFHFLKKGVTLTERTQLKHFIARLFAREGKPLLSLNYIFCSDAYLLNINKQYLGHDFYTDIVTFELSERDTVEGEIYISVDRVRDNAGQMGETFKKELHRVIFHGALHLCGYKDKVAAQKKVMRAKEDEYLTLYLG